MRCSSSGCSGWDYTTKINLLKPTDELDENGNPIFIHDQTLANVITPYGTYMQGGGSEGFSPNWVQRFTYDVTDFAPLLNANYSGGIIITDWISTDDINTNEFYKITIKFLSNEIRPDGLKISLHQKDCSKDNVCKVSKIQSSLSDDLALEILKRAALYKKEDTKKIAEELGEYKVQPAFNTGKKRK